MKERRAPDPALLALLIVTAVGAAIRFATLGTQSVDHDEAFTAVQVIKPGLGATLSQVADTERSPPLFYLLEWLFTRVLGTGAVDLRMLSAIAGTLTIPASYLAARELATRRAGVIAASLVAISPFMIWYSQEARSYALLILFSTVALFAFARSLRNPTGANLALWVLASALALCSHYFAVFAILPEGLWLIRTVRPRERALATVGAAAAVGLALLPLALAQEGNDRPNPFREVPVFTRGWQTLVHFASSAEPKDLGGGTGVHVFYALAAAAGVCLVLAAIAILQRYGDLLERRGATLAAGVGAISFALPLLLALVGLDFVDTRNLAPSAVPFLVAGGIAYGSRGAGGTGLAAAIAACAVFAALLVGVYQVTELRRTDWQRVAEGIGPAPGTRVIVTPYFGREPLRYYLEADQFQVSDPPVVANQLDLMNTAPEITPPPPPFRLVSKGWIDDLFYHWRYRAPRPVPVSFDEVGGHHVIDDITATLVTGARR